MRKLILLFMLACITFGMHAQRVIKELPPSFAFEQISKASLQSAQKLAIPFNVDALKAEDAKLEGFGFPTRVAKNIPVEWTPANAGEWTTLPDGQRIWRLDIEAPGANAISLLYDQFVIPEGGILYIYNLSLLDITAYTSLDNPKKVEYASDFIRGDKIRLEYVEPGKNGASAENPTIELLSQKDLKGKPSREEALKLLQASPKNGFEMPKIKITGVSYAYKDVIACIAKKLEEAYNGINPQTPSHDGASLPCEVNVNCPEGENWYHQKKGVAATLQVLSDNQYICSGTVVNNVLRDMTPYFLMAYHCGGDATDAQFNQWRFYFHWERTGCSNTSPLATYQVLTGATKRVALPLNGASDGLLLELNQPIPREWDVFYNGWDRRSSAIAGGVGIHHPAGDVKKISTYTQVPTSSTANMTSGETGATNAHWNVSFVATPNGFGFTEGGSSGSPLFNSAGRVIGTLTGGNTVTCATASGNYEIYGKMSWHWDQSPNANLRMAKYLDPNNSGAEYIDGTYGEDNLVSFTASATNIYASEEITYTNHSFGDIDTWVWSFPGGYPSSHSGKNPPVVAYQTEGNFTAKLTAKKGSALVGEYEIPIKVTLKQNYCPAASPVSIGNGTSASQYPLGFAARQTLDATVYTAADLGLTAGSAITAVEWTANTAVNTVRTLQVYLQEINETAFAAGTTWADEIANATLVFESASWTNTAGANKITLTTPFIYSGGKNLKVLVRAAANAATTTSSNCTYTVGSSNTHQQWTGTAATIPTTVGTRNANRPNIKVYYSTPCGVLAPEANFSVSSSTIYEGQSVTFKDLSTGPVVTYDWTLPGGIPSTSKEASPVVTYMNEGVYDASVFIKNSVGTAAKTVAGAVTVQSRIPLPQFAISTNALTRQADFGPFMPVSGGVVEFENRSLYYPKSIAWTFEGGDPSTSTEENPVVTYPAGENKYDVTLTATNSAGTAQKTLSDYIQIGGTSEIWNVREGENPIYRYTISGYGATGAHFFSQTAERFTVPAGGEVSKVRILCSNIIQLTGYYMTVAIYSDNGGVPGTAISPVLQLQGGSGTSAIPTGYNTFTFPNPVPVSGAFHVVVGTTNKSFLYYTVPCVEARTDGYSTVSAYYQDTWVDLGALAGLSTTMNIVPEFTYTSVELTSPVLLKKKNIDTTEETITFNTTGHSWTAKADSWIQLSAASGLVTDGIGSLKLSVSENTKKEIRRGTIRLNSGGNEFKVYVIQAGTYPENMTAELDETNTSVELNWEYEILHSSRSGDKISGDGKNAAAAEEDNVEETLQWHSGSPEYIYGNPNGGRMEAAVRFAPEDLVLYDQAKLKAVGIYTYRLCENLVLNIRQGNRIVYSQPVGNITQNLLQQRIELTTPVVIDASEDLYIGYEYDQYEGDAQTAFVPIADGGPVVAGKGDLFSYQGAPFSSTGVGNWIITGYVEPHVVNITFNVYKNGQLIAEGLTETTYTDTEEILDNMKLCYTVTAVYGEPELESTESDPACLRTPIVIAIKGSESTEFCENETVELFGPEESSYTYTWFKDGEQIEGAADSIYIVTQSGSYYLQVYDGEIELPASNTIEVTVHPVPLKPSITLLGGTNMKVSFEILEPQEGVKYQWYRDLTPVGEPVTSNIFSVEESGSYYVVAINDNDCESYPSNSLSVTIIDANTLFSVPGDPIRFVPDGSAPEELTVTVSDPKGYFESLGLILRVNTPEWITATISGRIITFVAGANTTGARRTGIVQVWYGQNATFDPRNGYEIAVSQNPIIEITADGPVEFCEGGSVVLSALESSDFIYQWYKNNEAIDGQTASAYTAVESGSYAVQIKIGDETLPLSNAIEVTVHALPATPEISAATTQLLKGETTTIAIATPQTGVLYQWYKGAEALGNPGTNSNYTVNEAGTYSVIATNENCTSEKSNEVTIAVIDPLTLFNVPTDTLLPNGHGGASGEIAVTLSDPGNFISTLGLRLYTNTPEWMTATVNGNVITFTANANTSGALRTGVVQIWYGRENTLRSSAFNPATGYEIGVKQKSLQTIHFEAPAILYWGDATYRLTATAGNGIEIAYSIRPEDSGIVEIRDGNVLFMKNKGTIVVTASAAGNNIYEDADDVSRAFVIDSRTGITKVDSEKGLKMYPNPSWAGMKFHVVSGLSDAELNNAYIDAFNMSGTLIQRQKVTGKETEMSLPLPGIYLLRLKGEETLVIIK